jgi:N-acetylmuramoyl-L-alanine amidase
MQKGKISEMKKLMFPLALLLGVIALGTTPSTESPALQAQNNRQQQKPPFIVCIDPGHPSETSAGANAHGLSENRLNWQVAVRLAQRLGAMNIPYVLTKASEKQYVTNRRRAEIANGANPYRRPTALFIRLHCDVGSGRGFTWYYPDRTGRKGNVVGPPRDVQIASRSAPHHEQRMIPFCAAICALIRLKPSEHLRRRQARRRFTGSIYRASHSLIEMCYINQKLTPIHRVNKRQEKMAEAMAAGIARWKQLRKKLTTEAQRAQRAQRRSKG